LDGILNNPDGSEKYYNTEGKYGAPFFINNTQHLTHVFVKYKNLDKGVIP
jgi:hypothetical protein